MYEGNVKGEGLKRAGKTGMKRRKAGEEVGRGKTKH